MKTFKNPILTKPEAEQALDTAIALVRRNLPLYTDHCQNHSSVHDIYPQCENNQWTCGFWPGEVWLSYERTGDEAFKNTALTLVDSFLYRIEHKIDARFRQLREVQTAPLGEIQLVTAPACRLFWMDASLSAENYSDLELSTSRFAAMQGEAVVFLGKVGFSISAAHLKDRRYTQYDGTFLLPDDDDHFDGALMNCPEALCVRVRFRGHQDQYWRPSAYMAEHSLAVAGFSREIAVLDQGFTHDRDKFITEICIPVERQT